MPAHTPAYFPAYDDELGWEAFLRDPGRSTFGFTERHATAAERVEPGDILLCYLKGSRWSGVLRVVADGAPDSTPHDRLELYPVRKPVERLITLPAYKAVSIFEPEVWNGLSRTRDLAPRSQGWVTKAGLRSDLAKLSEPDGKLIVQAIAARAAGPLPPDAAWSGGYDPQGEVDAREWTECQVVARRGQQAFRSELMTAYGGRCSISGCDVADVLEAAHVTPYLGPQTNHVTNGLLLRADLHTLWDCHLLMADPVTRTVILHSRLKGSSYEQLEGGQLRAPLAPKSAPSVEALRCHFALCRGPAP